ncbi:MAG: Uxx-star family glutaredoxin-like (seleno)protein [Dehalococcoidia bacterium]|jgi:glutaredoxin-like YruB-family protein|nr:Uxx-star family glutaredoxin-like (seleno)protein [Dehalococcoidia bacterium]
MDVEVYTTPTCGYCLQAKKFLSERRVEFVEYDVSQDRAAADKMAKLTNQMGVPVVVVDGEVLIGFDRPRLESLLAKTGNSQRPHFGLHIADASKIAQKTGTVPVFGALVGRVASSSLGEKAGLKQGDIITEANLRPIHNADDLEQALSALVVGSRMAIVFLRGRMTMKSELVV